MNNTKQNWIVYISDLGLSNYIEHQIGRIGTITKAYSFGIIFCQFEQRYYELVLKLNGVRLVEKEVSQ